MPSNYFMSYTAIARFARARSADMNQILASILSGFAKTNDYTVATGNVTLAATDNRRILLVPSGAMTITLPAAGTLTAATERDFEFLFGGMPTNNLILPASPTATINFNSVTVEGRTISTGQVKMASAGAYLRLRYLPTPGTYVIVDQDDAPRVFGTPSSGTAIAPWAWYGDHVVVDGITNASITGIAMPTAKMLGRSFVVTVALAMASGVVVGGGGDTINGTAGGYTVPRGQSVEFVREDAGWRAIILGETGNEITLRAAVSSPPANSNVQLEFNSIIIDTTGSVSVPTDSIVAPWTNSLGSVYTELTLTITVTDVVDPVFFGATGLSYNPTFNEAGTQSITVLNADTGFIIYAATGSTPPGSIDVYVRLKKVSK